jgi:hypothetical protein
MAFGRLSKSRGGTPIDVRLALQARPCSSGTANDRCVCRRFASDFFFFFVARVERSETRGANRNGFGRDPLASFGLHFAKRP